MSSTALEIIEIWFINPNPNQLEHMGAGLKSPIPAK
jgi:hypothetical protein